MRSIHRRNVAALAIAMGVMLVLLAAGGAHARPAQKAPAAMTVVSAEKRLTPGQESTFVVSCPPGYILTDTNIHAVTSPSGSERPDPKAAGLRVNREQISLTTMLLDIGNSGNEVLRVFASGRCVRTMVRAKVGGAPVGARLKDNGIVKQDGIAGPAATRNDCGAGRQAIGHNLSELPLFHPLSFLQTVIVHRRIVRWALMKPPTLNEALDELAFRTVCTSLRARVTKQGAPKRRQRRALASALPGARVIVGQIRRSREIPPHPSPNQTTQIAVQCPRRFTATSFGWDGPGADLKPLSVQLRRSLYPSRRRVGVEVSNTSGTTQTAMLTAICLSIRFGT